MANQLGTIAIKASSYQRAESILCKALTKYTETKEVNEAISSYSHLLYNLGNLYMAKKDHLQALHYYKEALQASPFVDCCDFDLAKDESAKFQFNS